MNKYLFIFSVISFIINEIIYFIFEILLLIYPNWITKGNKNIFYITFSFSCIKFIYLILFFLIFKIYKNNKRIINIINIISAIVYYFTINSWILEFSYIIINYNDFNEYLKNCPYIISDLKYNLHIKRRCELYNINYNSRYSYQYICSYNSSKDFKNYLTSEIKNNSVICIPFKEQIPNKEKIKLFLNEYKNEEKFYCSRTNIPNDYPLIKHEECYNNNNNKKHKFLLITVILSFLRNLFIFWPFFLLISFLDEPQVYNRDNIFFINSFNFSRESTNISTIQNNNEIIQKQNTINIIIENKKEFILNTNIKNHEQNNNNSNNSIEPIIKNNITIFKKTI